MLTIGKLGGSDGASRSPAYYTSIVATGREDYYAGRGEAAGEWVGHGAAVLGLSGEVDADDLGALMDGTRPGSDEQLRRPFGERAVVGFDLTFSAPKSVSILYGAGDEQLSRAVREAHDGAVRAALGYMEREACRARRGHAGVERVAGEGFAAGAFRHRTSRAGDPQLHTHAVVCNLTRGPDDRWTALDGRPLYHHAKTGGCLYQAELRARLSDSLGVEWTAVENGVAEIKGIPRPVIDHFSTRRAEIVDRLEAHGARSGRSAQVAAYETRRAKDYSVPIDRLREEWRARAAEHGLSERELHALLERPGRPELKRVDFEQAAGELAGPAGLTREASAFDRRGVLQAWAERHRRGATVGRVEQLADAFLRSPHAVQLEGLPQDKGKDEGQSARLAVGPAGPRYSTPDMLECELRLIDLAAARAGEGAGRAPGEAVEAAIAARATIAAEQAQMVRGLAGSGDGVELVRAPAGTGKTFALDAAREAWQAAGLRVVGATLSARAACELRDAAGVDSLTIKQLLLDLDRGWGFSSRNVVVVDEAGMVGTRALERIASAAADARAKLVLVGDDGQLPEIDAGGAFRALAERLGAHELRQVRRQRDAWDRAALRALREGRPERWARDNAEHGRLLLAPGRERQLERLVADWWAAREQLEEPDGVLMLAYRRDDVRELNERGRAFMRATGRLDDTELTVGDRAFAAGDRILCLDNDRRIGVLNGQRGTVCAIEQASRSLVVELDHERRVALPASYLEAGHLDHAYAMTVHKSQGMTVERSFVLGSEDLYKELGYTALSRQRATARFYINVGESAEHPQLPGLKDEKRDPLGPIVRALGTSRAKQLAVDVHERDDELRAVPTAELAVTAELLPAVLKSYPPDARRADRLAEEALRLEAESQAARERLEGSRREQAKLGRLARRARAELAERVARQEAALAAREHELARAQEAAVRAEAAGEGWVDEHAVELARLVAVERELSRRRDEGYQRALRSVATEPPGRVRRELGERPEGLAARDLWDRAAASLMLYQERYGEPPGHDDHTDPDRSRAWRAVRQATNLLELAARDRLRERDWPEPAHHRLVDRVDIDR